MSPQQAAQQLLSIFVAAGARTGRSFSVSLGKPIVEIRTIPNDGLVSVRAAGAFAWDGGVAFAADDVALTAVLGAPAQGQYAQAGGVYQFNGDDALKAVQITFRHAPAQRFPGAVQASFLGAGYGLADLIGGLAYGVAQGWLSTDAAPSADHQIYVLEQAGFEEAHGAAPALAASAKRLIRVAAAMHNKAGGARFDASMLLRSFIGTSDGNTFEPEDFVPGYGQALANGWVRPAGINRFEPVFTITASGIAAVGLS